MKNLTYLVGALVTGIVFTFVMSIVTVVQEKKAEEVQTPQAIVTPATAQ